MSTRLMRLACLTMLGVLGASSARAQIVPGTLDFHWNEGAKDCKANPQPPLEVHAYESQTYILRESPCADFEANFLYLLIGSSKAMLIDTGAVADAKQMPLAETVLRLLPVNNGARMPLLVVHTHKHLDHRAGDGQFEGLPGVQLVPATLESVKKFFGFPQWPEGVSHVDLGGRIVDVIPAPGHQENHVVFYDNRTALVFSGDFLMPGRLLVEDAQAFQASAVRVANFLRDRPVAHILGAHIELDANGNTYWFGTEYHPHERALALSKDDLMALPKAFEAFNGFYGRHPNYVLYNSMRILAIEAVGALSVLVLFVWLAVRWLKRVRRKKRAMPIAA
jgi:hydroxyacylglutathione hydrolase